MTPPTPQAGEHASPTALSAADLSRARFAANSLAGRPVGGAEVDSDLLTLLAGDLVQQQFSPNNELCHLDDWAAGIWIIQAGTAELTMGNGEDRIVLQTVCRGEAFGVVQLINGQRRPYTVRATSPVTALLLPVVTFAQLRAKQTFTELVISGLARRLVQVWDRLAAVLGDDLRTRTARILLVENRGGVVPLAQATLANLLGVTRPAINAALGTLQRAGLVELHYRRIVIADRVGLVAAAHVHGPPGRPADLL